MSDDERDLVLNVYVNADNVEPTIQKVEKRLGDVNKALTNQGTAAAAAQKAATDATEKRRKATDDLGTSVAKQAQAEKKALEDQLSALKQYRAELAAHTKDMEAYAKLVHEVERENQVAQSRFRQGQVRKFEPVTPPPAPAVPISPYPQPTVDQAAVERDAAAIVAAEEAHDKAVETRVAQKRKPKAVKASDTKALGASPRVTAADLGLDNDREKLIQQLNKRGRGRPTNEEVRARQAVQASEVAVEKAVVEAAKAVVDENQKYIDQINQAAAGKFAIRESGEGKLLPREQIEATAKDRATLEEAIRRLKGGSLLIDRVTPSATAEQARAINANDYDSTKSVEELIRRAIDREARQVGEAVKITELRQATGINDRRTIDAALRRMVASNEVKASTDNSYSRLKVGDALTAGKEKYYGISSPNLGGNSLLPAGESELRLLAQSGREITQQRWAERQAELARIEARDEARSAEFIKSHHEASGQAEKHAEIIEQGFKRAAAAQARAEAAQQKAVEAAETATAASEHAGDAKASAAKAVVKAEDTEAQAAKDTEKLAEQRVEKAKTTSRRAKKSTEATAAKEPTSTPGFTRGTTWRDKLNGRENALLRDEEARIKADRASSEPDPTLSPAERLAKQRAYAAKEQARVDNLNAIEREELKEYLQEVKAEQKRAEKLDIEPEYIEPPDGYLTQLFLGAQENEEEGMAQQRKQPAFKKELARRKALEQKIRDDYQERLAVEEPETPPASRLPRIDGVSKIHGPYQLVDDPPAKAPDAPSARDSVAVNEEPYQRLVRVYDELVARGETANLPGGNKTDVSLTAIRREMSDLSPKEYKAALMTAEARAAEYFRELQAQGKRGRGGSKAYFNLNSATKPVSEMTKEELAANIVWDRQRRETLAIGPERRPPSFPAVRPSTPPAPPAPITPPDPEPEPEPQQTPAPQPSLRKSAEDFIRDYFEAKAGPGKGQVGTTIADIREDFGRYNVKQHLAGTSENQYSTGEIEAALRTLAEEPGSPFQLFTINARHLSDFQREGRLKIGRKQFSGISYNYDNRAKATEPDAAPIDQSLLAQQRAYLDRFANARENARAPGEPEDHLDLVEARELNKLYEQGRIAGEKPLPGLTKNPRKALQAEVDRATKDAIAKEDLAQEVERLRARIRVPDGPSTIGPSRDSYEQPALDIPIGPETSTDPYLRLPSTPTRTETPEATQPPPTSNIGRTTITLEDYQKQLQQATEPEAGLTPAEKTTVKETVKKAAKPRAKRQSRAKQRAVEEAAAEGVNEAVQEAEREQAQELTQPNSSARPRSFRGRMGSLYDIHEDGSTTRTPSTEPDKQFPRSEKTFYVSYEDARKLRPENLGTDAAVSLQSNDTHAAFRYESGPNAGKYAGSTRVAIQKNPAPGLNPVETFEGGRKFHFGTEVGKVAFGDGSSIGDDSSVQTGFDPTVAAARKPYAGPKFLDDLMAGFGEYEPLDVDEGPRAIGGRPLLALPGGTGQSSLPPAIRNVFAAMQRQASAQPQGPFAQDPRRKQTRDRQNLIRKDQRRVRREQKSLGKQMLEIFSQFQLPSVEPGYEEPDFDRPFGENERDDGGAFVNRIAYAMRRVSGTYRPGSARQGQLAGRQPLQLGPGPRRVFPMAGGPLGPFPRPGGDAQEADEAADQQYFSQFQKTFLGMPGVYPPQQQPAATAKRRSGGRGRAKTGASGIPGLDDFLDNLGKLGDKFDETGRRKDHFINNLTLLGGVFQNLGNQAGGLAGGGGRQGGQQQGGQQGANQGSQQGTSGPYPTNTGDPVQDAKNSRANKAADDAAAAAARKVQAEDDRDTKRTVNKDFKDTQRIVNDNIRDVSNDSRDTARIVNQFAARTAQADSINAVNQSAQHRKAVGDLRLDKERADKDAAQARARAAQIRADDAARAAARRARLDVEADKRNENRPGPYPRGILRGIATASSRFIRTAQPPTQRFFDRFNRRAETYFLGPTGSLASQRAGAGRRLGDSIYAASNNSIAGLFNPRFFGNLRAEFSKTTHHAEGFFASMRAGFRKAFADENGKGAFKGFFTGLSTSLSEYGDNIARSFQGMGQHLLSFRSLIVAALAALGPLVAMLGSVAAGALGLANALSQLAGSALALPSLFAAAATAIGALVVAMKPLSGILDAYASKQKAVNSANAAGISSSERAKRAQEDLNKVRRDAQRQLEDLQAAVNRANLTENGAILGVKQARQRYLESLADPNSSVLDQQSAYQAYLESQARLEDVRRENARNKEDLKTLPAENARKISEAEKTARAGGDTAVSSANNELERQLGLVGPNTKKFALGLAAIFLDENGPWKKTQKTIAEGLFTPLAPELGNIEKLLVPLQKLLGSAASTLGELAADAINTLATPEWMRFFDQLADVNVGIIEDFGTAAGFVATAFKSIMEAVSSPLLEDGRSFIQWFTDGIVNIARKFSNWAAEANQSGSLGDFLKQVRLTLIDVGAIVGNLFGAFRNLFVGSNDFTRDLLGTLVRVTEKFEEWSESAADPNSGFRRFLADTMPLLKDVGQLVVDIVKAFFQIASDPKNIQEAHNILDSLRTKVLPGVVKFFTELADSGLVSKLANALGTALSAIGEFLDAGGGTALAIAVSGVEHLVNALSALLNIPGVAEILSGVAIALGALAAASLFAKFTGLSALARLFGFFLKNKNDLRELFKGVGGFFSGRNSPGASGSPGGVPGSPLNPSGGGGGAELAVLKSIDVKLSTQIGLLQRIATCVCATAAASKATAAASAATAAGTAATAAGTAATAAGVAGALAAGGAGALAALPAGRALRAVASVGRPAIAATAFRPYSAVRLPLQLGAAPWRSTVGGAARTLLADPGGGVVIPGSLATKFTAADAMQVAGASAGRPGLISRLTAPLARVATPVLSQVSGSAFGNILRNLGGTASSTASASRGFITGLPSYLGSRSLPSFGNLAQDAAGQAQVARGLPAFLSNRYTPAIRSAFSSVTSPIVRNARAIAPVANAPFQIFGDVARSFGGDFTRFASSLSSGLRSIAPVAAEPFRIFGDVGRSIGGDLARLPGVRNVLASIQRPSATTAEEAREALRRTVRVPSPRVTQAGTAFRLSPNVPETNFFRSTDVPFRPPVPKAASVVAKPSLLETLSPRLKTAGKATGVAALAALLLGSAATAAQAPDTDAEGNPLGLVDQLGGGLNVGIGATSGTALTAIAAKKVLPDSVFQRPDGSSRIPGISTLAKGTKNLFGDAIEKLIARGGVKGVGANVLSKLPSFGSRLLAGGGNPLTIAGTALGIGADLAYTGDERRTLPAQFLRSQGAALTAAGYGAQFGGPIGAAAGYVAGNVYSLAKDKGYRVNLENAVTDPTSQYGNNKVAKTIGANPIVAGIAGIFKGADQGDKNENVVVRMFKGGREAFEKNFGQPLRNVGKRVLNWIYDLPGRFRKAVGYMIGFLGTKLIRFGYMIGQWIRKLPERVESWWKSWTFADVWNAIYNNVFKKVWEFFFSLPDRVMKWWDSWTFGEVWDKIYANVVTPVVDWFMNLPAAVTAWWESWSFSDLWDKFYAQFIGPVVGWFKNMPDRIKEAWNEFWGSVGEGSKDAGGLPGSLGKQSGGVIEGTYDGRVDTRLVPLTIGEFVARKRVVDKPMGKMLLTELNEERLQPADFYAALNGATKMANLSVSVPAMSVVGQDRTGDTITNTTTNHNRGGNSFGDVHIHNPVREKSDLSMRRTLHKLAYMSER